MISMVFICVYVFVNVLIIMQISSRRYTYNKTADIVRFTEMLVAEMNASHDIVTVFARNLDDF